MSLRSKGISTIKSALSAYWTRILGEIPLQDLEEKHIANTKILVNREELLMKLGTGGTVAELGIDQGDFSQKILDICKPEVLHLVDFWGSSRYNKSKQSYVEARFEDRIQRGEVVINLGLSTEVVHNFEDGMFDWVYIDTDHTYATTKSELETYSQKMKVNGIIAGHDYVLGNWKDQAKYGVMEAVHEFCVTNNWEIIYLTINMREKNSFAIRRIMSADEVADQAQVTAS